MILMTVETPDAHVTLHIVPGYDGLTWLTWHWPERACPYHQYFETVEEALDAMPTKNVGGYVPYTTKESPYDHVYGR